MDNLNIYKADLHIHTVLSPCGDLYMSPANIIDAACKKGIDIIGITDHNSTEHGPLIQKLAKKSGLFVLAGVEVTTKEEAHCLAFFESSDHLQIFQLYLDEHLLKFQNNPDEFGYQVVLDENEDIVCLKELLLISAINQSIDQVEQKVHELQGIFIPAHINKGKNSLTSQLGFVPPDLNVDALELSRHITVPQFKQQNSYLNDYTFIQSSDAHFIDDVGTVYTNFCIKNRSFSEIKLALHGLDGRRVFVK